ncbi:MAG: DUF1015 domain-containing protein [Oscillospiraceae bacterium]|nr:DUF1015 domain-containing protein [Oscillospiraceae bacterium]
MATFVPFQGTRYDVPGDILGEYVCPPYDIISKDMRKELILANQNNIVSVELPEGGDDRYSVAGDNLKRMLTDHLLVADETEQFYVYEMKFAVDGRWYNLEGIIGRMKLEPFENGIILPHENTLSAAKNDRFNLMKETFANISPIYSLFSDEDGAVQTQIDKALATTPIASVNYDDVIHSIYSLSGEDALLIEQTFFEKKIYIADGHHRYETGLRFKEYCKEMGMPVEDSNAASYIMMACVSMHHPGLVVLPTHRTINPYEGFDSKKLLEDVSAEFTPTRLTESEAIAALQISYENDITSFIYYDGEYTLLTLKNGIDCSAFMPGRSESYTKLDVSILHSCILTPYLKISEEDLLKGTSLVYTRDLSEAVARVDTGDSCCAFILNPTHVPAIAQVASDGERMPQKSTYFYPKLLTGLVINVM